MVSASSPAMRPAHNDPHRGQFVFLGGQIADDRRLAKGHIFGPRHIIEHRVVAQLFKAGQPAAVQGRIPRLRRFFQRRSGIQFFQIAAGGGIRQAGPASIFPPASSAPFKNSILFSHAQRAHNRAQIGAVDLDADIALQKRAAALLRQMEHVFKTRPIQHKIRQLGIPGSAQHLPGFANGALQNRRQPRADPALRTFSSSSSGGTRPVSTSSGPGSRPHSLCFPAPFWRYD